MNKKKSANPGFGDNTEQRGVEEPTQVADQATWHLNTSE